MVSIPRSSFFSWVFLSIFSLIILSSFVSAAGCNLGTFASPLANQNISGIFSVNWSATGSCGSGNDKYDVYHNQNGTGFPVTLNGNIANNITNKFNSWNTSLVPDGSFYQVKVCEADNLANCITSGTFRINNSATTPDTTAPVVSTSGNLVVEATNASGASVSFSAANATDNVNGFMVATCNRVSGSTFAIGTTVVNCTATDLSNNTGSKTFSIVVQDTTAPTLTVPSSDVTEEATNASGASVSYSVSANDLVDSNPVIVCIQNSGSLFSIGTTVVTCNATDSYNNVAVKTFNVIVQDTTDPSTTLSVGNPSYNNGDVYVTSDTEFELDATDIVDVNQTFYTINGGSSIEYTGAFSIVDSDGDYTIEYWSVDTSGNIESAQTFDITLDNSAPETDFAINSGSKIGSVYIEEISFNLSCSDDDSGCSKIYYAFNDDNYTSISGNFGTVSSIAVSDGQNVLHYFSQDNLGNNESSDDIEFQIDRTSPYSIPISFYGLNVTFINVPSGVYSFSASSNSSTSFNTEGAFIGSNFFDLLSSLTNGEFNVSLTFYYNDSNNDALVDETGVFEDDLNVYFYNTTSGSWEFVNPSSRDRTLNTITVTIDHFTQFALLYFPISSTSTVSDDSGEGSTGARRGISISTSGAAANTVPTQGAEANTDNSNNIGTNVPITGAVVGTNTTRNVTIGVIFIILVIIGAVYFNTRKKKLNLKKSKKSSKD